MARRANLTTRRTSKQAAVGGRSRFGIEQIANIAAPIATTIGTAMAQGEAREGNLALGDALTQGYMGGNMFDEQGRAIPLPGPSLMGRGAQGFARERAEIGRGFDTQSRLMSGRHGLQGSLLAAINRNAIQGAEGRQTAVMGRQDALQGAYATARARNLGYVDQMGQQERRDIGTRFDALNTQTAQRMTDLGMGSTTVGTSLRSGNERRRSDALRGLSGQLAMMRSGIDRGFTGAQLGAQERGAGMLANLSGDVLGVRMGAGEASLGQQAAFGAERAGLASGRSGALLANTQGANRFATNVQQNALNLQGQTQIGYPDTSLPYQMIQQSGFNAGYSAPSPGGLFGGSGGAMATGGIGGGLAAASLGLGPMTMAGWALGGAGAGWLGGQ